jgi:hypothetical protein
VQDFAGICRGNAGFSLFSKSARELWISISGFESLGGSQFLR